MKITITFLLVFTNLLSAQIKGVVKDSITGKPIPYVGIWTNIDSVSVSTNKKGIFEIAKTESINEILLFPSNYIPKKIKLKNLKDEIILVPKQENTTKEKPNRNSEYIVCNEVGINKNYFSSTTFSSTKLLAKYIPYQEEFNDRKFLKKIKIGLVSKSKSSIYKIRFFETDLDGKPGKEIYNSEINDEIFVGFNNIMNFEFSKEINILNKKIIFPKNGLFVVIEICYFRNNMENLIYEGKTHKILNPNIISYNNQSQNLFEYKNGEWIKSEKNFSINLTLTN